jgi:hypothetical protein
MERAAQLQQSCDEDTEPLYKTKVVTESHRLAGRNTASLGRRYGALSPG